MFRFSLSLLVVYLGSTAVLVNPISAQHMSKSPTLTYQASINKEGPLTLTARLYSDPSGLDLVWEETSEVVSIQGVIDHELGLNAALPVDRMADGLFLGISIDHSEELRPLTRLTASPLALSVPDGAISSSKISASYIESITINGRKIDGAGAKLRIETGKGITAGYDEGTNTILLASSASGGKGSFGTLADEVVDGNLTVNGNTNLGGSAVNPTITFVAKAASDLDMDSNDLLDVGALSLSGELALTGTAAPVSLNGSAGTSGQVLTSAGTGSTPTWSSIDLGWGGNGRSGTTAGVDYLGTSDDEPFEIHVDHNGSASEGRQRVLRFEPNYQSANIILGHNSNVASWVIGATIGGGGASGYAHDIYGNYGTISGGRANEASNFASVGGGEYNRASHVYSTVGGGYNNQATSNNSAVLGGYNNWARANSSVVGGGEDNVARGNLSVVAGGYTNKTMAGASSIGGGEWNLADNTAATIGGGSNNYASGYASFVGGGEWNVANALHATTSGGYYNTANGQASAIPGGRYLTVGERSFGFNADASGTLTNLSSMSAVSYFGNTDLMIGNVDNSARSLRFYEPNASYSYSGTNYTSFRAPAMGSNVEYTLPSSQGASGSVLSNNGTGALSWQVLTMSGDVSGPLGASTVQFVGGESSANIALATSRTNGATADNTPNMIVARDASGNFAAGTITANVTGDVTGNITGNAGTVTNGVYTTGSYADPSWITSLAASKITGLTIDNTSFTGDLEGDVTGTQGATVVSLVGGATASQVAGAVTIVAAATSSNTASTLVQRDASGDVSLSKLTASGGVAVSNGVLTLSSSTVTSSNAGIVIPSGYSIVRITPAASSNFSYTLPSGTEGQVLYIYNTAAKRANNGVQNVDSGSLVSFLYLNGSWVPVD